MAKERRVPRRQSKQPSPPQLSALGKAGTRHSLKGPGRPQVKSNAKGRRVRAIASAAEYEEDYGDDEQEAGSGSIMVPTRWVKFVAALLLLPVCWVVSKTFFGAFQNVMTIGNPFWKTEEFYFFALGALLWMIAFVGLPRPLVIYVFGHELTHALWVWIQLGEVSDFNVGRDGGYIIADRRDFLVSLAPYFFPLYSILVIAVFGAAGHYYPSLWDYRRWFYAAIGVTWAFHFTFTCWMIPKQQTDLLLHGTFFSLVVIYLANICVLAVLLITACPTVSWEGFGSELKENAADFSVMVRDNTVQFCERAGWLH